METFAEFLVSAGNELNKMSPLQQVLTLLTLVGAVPLVTGSIVWVTRRFYVGNLTRAKMRIENLEAQIELDRSDLMDKKAEADELRQRLHSESPIAWRQTDLSSQEARVNGLIAADEGFERIREDLRAAAFQLAHHNFSLSELDDDKECLKKAWYYGSVAQALRNDEDVQELRDAIREVEAEIERLAGRYDPGDPRWNQFDLLPLPESAEVLPLVTTLAARARELMRNGETVVANRLVARASYLSLLVLGPHHPTTLVVRDLGAQIMFGAGYLTAALDEATSIAETASKALGGTHPLTLQARHMKAACLYRLERREEARQEAESMLPILEDHRGKDDPLTLATKALIDGSYLPPRKDPEGSSEPHLWIATN